MTKASYITSGFALLFGLFIFGLSLIMTSQVKSSSFPKFSEKKFYLGERILPDHVLYPALMVADSLILKSSFGNNRIYVKIRLSQDRLRSSQLLLAKNEEMLALSTMTKSQKYLITAAQDFLSSKHQSDSVKNDLLLALHDNMYELKRCQVDLHEIDTSPVGDLLVESSVLIDQLKNI
ncbi:hypothetical protein KA089_00330 [Candidatus Woesebacteria bacterium]|nr:hypothetical protein [Candidatus Woesebacteria bacterium]